MRFTVRFRTNRWTLKTLEEGLLCFPLGKLARPFGNELGARLFSLSSLGPSPRRPPVMPAQTFVSLKKPLKPPPGRGFFSFGI